MNLNETSPRRIYRVRPLRMAAAVGVPALFAIALLGVSLLTTEPAERSALAVAGIIMVMVAAGLFPLVWYPKLLVSPSGIEIRQVGWSIRTTWDNVEAVELSPPGEGLLLRAPLTGRGAWALRVGRIIPAWYTPEQARLVAEGRWFPLSPFGWWLRHGDLLAELKRHAPGLFP